MSIKYSDNFKLSIIREYEKGQKSNALIAREFGVARSTVTKWIKKYGKECPKKINIPQLSATVPKIYIILISA